MENKKYTSNYDYAEIDYRKYAKTFVNCSKIIVITSLFWIVASLMVNNYLDSNIYFRILVCILSILVILYNFVLGIINFQQFKLENDNHFIYIDETAKIKYVVAKCILKFEDIEDLLVSRLFENNNPYFRKRMHEIKQHNPNGMLYYDGFHMMMFQDKCNLFSDNFNNPKNVEFTRTFTIVIFGKDTGEMYQFDLKTLFPEIDSPLKLFTFMKQHKLKSLD